MFGLCVSAYLFLAGMAGGSFVSSALVAHLSRSQSGSSYGNESACVRGGFFITPIFVVLSLLFLMFDLGRADRAWEIALHPFGSLVSIGAWLVALFGITSAAALYLTLFARPVHRHLLRPCSILGCVLAFGVMTYTGLLLSDMPSIEFWNTMFLPVLFVLSSCSTGIAASVLVGTVFAAGKIGVDGVRLWKGSAVVAAVEFIALVAFVVRGAHAGGMALASVEELLGGAYLTPFWIGVVAIGVLLPAVCHCFRSVPACSAATVVGALATVVGGLFLRICIVGAAMQPVLFAFVPTL